MGTMHSEILDNIIAKYQDKAEMCSETDSIDEQAKEYAYRLFVQWLENEKYNCPDHEVDDCEEYMIEQQLLDEFCDTYGYNRETLQHTNLDIFDYDDQEEYDETYGDLITD